MNAGRLRGNSCSLLTERAWCPSPGSGRMATTMRSLRAFAVCGGLVSSLVFVSCVAPSESTSEEQLATTGPDLVFTSLSTATSNPLNVSTGSTFSVSDTTTNQASGSGAAASAASTNKYWLANGTTKVGSS